MNKQDSTYLCIKTFTFGKYHLRTGKPAFTNGNTYEGHQDKLGKRGDIELLDDTGNKHTITVRIFDTIFTECK